jgi:hypothetical protein
MIAPEEDFSAAVTGTVEPKNHFLHFLKSAVFEKCRKRNCEGMGSAIPIKLPENAFSRFGESVVSRRILRFLSRILRAKKKMVAPQYCEGRQSEAPCQTDKRGTGIS